MNSEGTKANPETPSETPTETLEVTLYTRVGCHLCEEARSQMAPLLLEFGARLREVDIDADPQLRELYNLDVPVIFLAGRKVAKHRLDLKKFKRQLQEARRRLRRS
jgi:glutaredoxin